MTTQWNDHTHGILLKLKNILILDGGDSGKCQGCWYGEMERRDG